MNKNSLRVSYASAVHDQEETKRVLAVLNEHRTIMGREIEEFEKRVANEFLKGFCVFSIGKSKCFGVSVRIQKWLT